jgi:hypothetical protein
VSKPDLLASLLAGGSDLAADAEIAQKRDSLLYLWRRDPWEFLTGKDVDGTPAIWTKDERDRENPFKPFPNYPYLRAWIDVLEASRPPAPDTADLIGCVKSRQMMISWATLLWIYAKCLFSPGQRWIYTKTSQNQANTILREKLETSSERLPAWLRERYPSIHTRGFIEFPITDSSIIGGDRDTAKSGARGGTCSGVFIDEATSQQGLEDLVGATLPMASMVIVVSTPDEGTASATVFRSMMECE